MSKRAWIRPRCVFLLVATFWLTSGSAGVPAAELAIPPSPPSEPAFEDCDRSRWTANQSTSTRPRSTEVPPITALCPRRSALRPSTSVANHRPLLIRIQSTRTIGSSGSRQPATGSPGGAAGHRPATRIILPDLIGEDRTVLTWAR